MFRDRWALVTGAGSGIGRATATLLAQQGARLILCDRDGARLQELEQELRARGVEALTYVVDVSDRAAMIQFADWVHERIPAVDFLINNAGVLAVGGLEETSWEDWDRIFSINFWGVVHSAKLFVPRMRERKSGAVVNVASASGRVGFSSLLAYSSSKFAVLGFSDGLRAELADAGISVSVVCPGLVQTNLIEDPSFSEELRGALRGLLGRHGLSPERVAEAIVSALQKRRAVVPVGSQAWGVEILGRFVPARASRWISQISSSSRWRN